MGRDAYDVYGLTKVRAREEHRAPWFFLGALCFCSVNINMATNPYFNNQNHKGEQDLFESLVIEHIQMNGVDITYIPRENIGYNEILVEPTQSKFKEYHTIEAYMPDTANFGGEQDIMSKFGYKIEQTTELLISKKRWEQLMPAELIRPREGDIVYIGDVSGHGSTYGSFVNTFFQINHVLFNSPDWQFGKNFVYKLACRTYIHSAEKFETGNPNLDQFNQIQKDEADVGINKPAQGNGAQILINRNNPFGDF